MLVYKRETFAFACETVIQIEPCKFYLSRNIFKAELTKEPIVKRSVIFKFERTQRVCYTLFVVGERVCEIIHGIYAPLVAGLMMRNVRNAVNNGVAHIYVRRRHINFCAQNSCTVREFAVCHTPEKVEVFLCCSVAVRTVFTGLGKSSAVFSYFVCGEVVNIRLTVLNKLYRTFIDKIKIARRIKALVPFEAEPLYILFYGVYVFGVLFLGICVVETQIAYSAVFLSRTEVYANCLCVAYMQITVGLRRKTCLDVVVNPFF